MMERKSRLETYLDILEVLNSGESDPTTAMHRSGLPSDLLSEMLNSLLKVGLIEVEAKSESRQISITPKGSRVLLYLRRQKEEPAK